MKDMKEKLRDMENKMRKFKLNLIVVRKQHLELDMEQQTGSKQEKEDVKAVYCHPAYLTYMQSTMRNAGLEEAQAGIKIAGRNINNLRYTDDITLWQTVKRN